MPSPTTARALRTARELAHAASALAAEAATLARIYEDHGGADDSIAAAEAAIRAAHVAFSLDQAAREGRDDGGAVEACVEALEAAAAAVAGARKTVDAVVDVTRRGGPAASHG